MKRRALTVFVLVTAPAAAQSAPSSPTTPDAAFGSAAAEGSSYVDPPAAEPAAPSPAHGYTESRPELTPRPVSSEEESETDEDLGQLGAKPWRIEPSIYFLLAGMAGEVSAYGNEADIDMSVRSLVDHLKFGAMGRFRFVYERWAFAVDVFYLNVTGEGINVSADASQWLVEPSVGFSIFDELEVLGGVRYNNLHLELRGDYPTVPTADFNFWDPFVGARVSFPILDSLSINLRADIGGFGIGSRVSWQVFPFFSWGFSDWGSFELGYRAFQTTYHTGSGITELDYDVITYGPQLGLTLHF